MPLEKSTAKRQHGRVLASQSNAMNMEEDVGELLSLDGLDFGFDDGQGEPLLDACVSWLLLTRRMTTPSTKSVRCWRRICRVAMSKRVSEL